MVDGPTEVQYLDLTETNRQLVRSFVETVLVNGQLDRLADYIDDESYAEHNPRIGDGLSALRSELESTETGRRTIDYQRILAEREFVLCVSEGFSGKTHSAFYDLFRIADKKLVENWDTTENIARRDEWKNDNGKF
jgi:predicted SnoaL-like aldol condensation-catalyzing enzyme